MIVRSRTKLTNKKLKKRAKVQQKSYPRQLSCRHIPSVHCTTNGKLVVICHPRQTSKLAFIDLAPNVWCGRCGWVKITDEEYEYYKEFDGAQKAIRPNPTS